MLTPKKNIALTSVMSLCCFIHVCKLKYNKLTFFFSKNIQKYCKTFLESLNTVVLPCTAYYNKHSGLSILKTDEDETLLRWDISTFPFLYNIPDYDIQDRNVFSIHCTQLSI